MPRLERRYFAALIVALVAVAAGVVVLAYGVSVHGHPYPNTQNVSTIPYPPR